jgi:hypothetical protein
MTTVENVVESGTTVVLDDKFFVNCRYTGCNLVYLGGDYGWIDSEFKDCKIMLQGAAQRTTNFMKHFGISPKEVDAAATQSTAQTGST